MRISPQIPPHGYCQNNWDKLFGVDWHSCPRTQWSRSFRTHDRLMIRLRNVLPGGTTLHACARWPIRVSSCLFLAALRLRQLFISSFNLSNFSCGRRNWRDSESISMARNVSWHVGPTIFSGANGTPSSLQVSMIWCRLLLHSLEVGEPTINGLHLPLIPVFLILLILKFGACFWQEAMSHSSMILLNPTATTVTIPILAMEATNKLPVLISPNAPPIPFETCEWTWKGQYVDMVELHWYC